MVARNNKKNRKKKHTGEGQYRGFILVRNVPEELKLAFKAYCARHGYPMQSRIKDLMIEDLKQNDPSIDIED